MASPIQKHVHEWTNKWTQEVDYRWPRWVTTAATGPLYTMDGVGKLAASATLNRTMLNIIGTNDLKNDKDTVNATVTADDASSERKLTAEHMPFDGIQVSKDFVITRA